MGNSCQKEKDKELERSLITKIIFKKDENNVISVEDLPFKPIKSFGDYEEAVIRVHVKSSDLINQEQNNDQKSR